MERIQPFSPRFRERLDWYLELLASRVSENPMGALAQFHRAYAELLVQSSNDDPSLLSPFIIAYAWEHAVLASFYERCELCDVLITNKLEELGLAIRS